jgi:predicted DNA-binding WGR domain protein
MDTDHDFRDDEPLWVRYAELSNAEHDKWYETRIDIADSGEYVLTKRWGRKPDTGRGQIKVEYYRAMGRAINVAETIMTSKIRKGYLGCERPYGASNQVFKEVGNDYYQEGEEAF